MLLDTTWVSYLPLFKMILHFLPLFIFTAGFILEVISSKKYVQLFLFSYTNQKQFYNQPINPTCISKDKYCDLPEVPRPFFLVFIFPTHNSVLGP